MKTFRCLAVAYNPGIHKDKLKPRGVSCVFLGYPLNQKLINLFTLQTFVTRNVKFHEDIFPYSLSFDEITQFLPLDDVDNQRTSTTPISIWPDPVTYTRNSKILQQLR